MKQGDLHSAPDDRIFDLLIGGIHNQIRFCLQHDGPQALPALAPLLNQAAQALFTASTEAAESSQPGRSSFIRFSGSTMGHNCRRP